MESKHLRLVHAGYENYTGPIGAYEFVNGVSVEAIPQNARDRLATAFQFMEVAEDGSEVMAGGPARMLREAVLTVEPTQKLLRQTEGEKHAEDLRALLGGERVRTLRSRKNLEGVADKMGIYGVRLVAGAWKVRSKSIPDLIDMVIEAQAAYVERRVEALVEKGADAASARALFILSDDVPMPVSEKEAEKKIMDANEAAAAPAPSTPAPVSAQTEVAAAATAGDMAAAISIAKE